MQGRPVLAHGRPWTVGVLADADGARRREVCGLGELGLVLLGPRARRQGVAAAAAMAAAVEESARRRQLRAAVDSSRGWCAKAWR